ncbi:MAG: hypothetical protein ACE5LH_03760 [Fidelibacterota bacterium]
MVKRFEPEDPLELKGTEIPDGNLEQQARIIMEEFLIMGAPREQVLELFKSPFFSGTHNLLRRLGSKKIATLLEEAYKQITSPTVVATENR